MTNTSSNLPECVHCGTRRPADETLCPNCANPWIDVIVSDVTPSESTAPAAASVAVPATNQGAATVTRPQARDIHDTGEFDFDDWTLPPEPTSSKAKWLIPFVLLVAVVALWILVFVNRGGTGSNDPIAVAETTTTEAKTTTTTTQQSTTSLPPTSTTSTTTTTVVYPLANEWETVGDPIPATELGLKASGIGPITFGSPIGETAGALVAALGEADIAGLDSELCASGEWYWIEWGDFRAIFDGHADDATFIAYRYEAAGPDTPDPELETLSGIRLGDTVEALQSTYGSYTVSFEVIEGKDHFRLLDGGELLLWGPVTSTEAQGTVEGIYSPDPCPSSN